MPYAGRFNHEGISSTRVFPISPSYLFFGITAARPLREVSIVWHGPAWASRARSSEVFLGKVGVADFSRSDDDDTMNNLDDEYLSAVCELSVEHIVDYIHKLFQIF